MLINGGGCNISWCGGFSESETFIKWAVWELDQESIYLFVKYICRNDNFGMGFVRWDFKNDVSRNYDFKNDDFKIGVFKIDGIKKYTS